MSSYQNIDATPPEKENAHVDDTPESPKALDTGGYSGYSVEPPQGNDDLETARTSLELEFVHQWGVMVAGIAGFLFFPLMWYCVIFCFIRLRRFKYMSIAGHDTTDYIGFCVIAVQVVGLVTISPTYGIVLVLGIGLSVVYWFKVNHIVSELQAQFFSTAAVPDDIRRRDDIERLLPMNLWGCIGGLLTFFFAYIYSCGVTMYVLWQHNNKHQILDLKLVYILGFSSMAVGFLGLLLLPVSYGLIFLGSLVLCGAYIFKSNEAMHTMLAFSGGGVASGGISSGAIPTGKGGFSSDAYQAL